MSKAPCVVVGSGNIGTDLLIKLLRSQSLEPIAMVGIDPKSDGLARARAEGVETTHRGIEWVMERAHEIDIVFEATSAWVSREHSPSYSAAGLQTIDLTPAKLGPQVVPTVNIDQALSASNVNLITCGGQATVPIVSAVSRVATVRYAEIVSTVASLSAGPGTRQNIDEFTETTASALTDVGGAKLGKAIMVLNPADPPIIMRNTVFCSLEASHARIDITNSIEEAVSQIGSYVPGYRLVTAPKFDEGPFDTPQGEVPARVVVLIEVEGSGDHLPAYAGNLDIMTASAVRVGELIVAEREGTDHG